MSTRSFKRAGLGCALLASLLAMAAQAPAQTPDEKAAARTAANEGREAFDNGDYAGAIERFRVANEIIKAPTHTLYLARSHDKLGHLVQARELYMELSHDDLGTNPPRAFREAQADARKELAALEPRIPYVTIKVIGPHHAEAEVTMDGLAVAATSIGSEQPVDPGEHTFSAKSKGAHSKTEKLTAQEGSHETVTLTLVSTAHAASPPPVFEPEPKPEHPDSAVDADTGNAGLRTLSYVAIGVGVVSAGAGVVFLVQKNRNRNDADTLFGACNKRVCTADERDKVNGWDDASSRDGKLSTAGFVIGGVGIAAGVTMLILSGGSSEPAKSTTDAAVVRPWVGVGSGGITGSF